jgi:2-polyprenyl-3-methyl-5-hydroxy-6-metoxy-1,4-benzoquinol methylase
MEHKIQQFWNKQAKRYDNSERQFTPVYKKIMNSTLTCLEKTDTLLDLGCATGTKAIKLAEDVKHVHGVDIADEMINAAMKKAEESGTMNVTFSQGTIFSEELKEGTFDKIVSYGVLHLLEDIEKVAIRINDLLKPGGLFITSIACLKDKMAFKNKLQFGFFMLIKKLGFFPLHLNMFKYEDTIQIIERNNFELIHREKIFSGMTVSFVIAKKL